MKFDEFLFSHLGEMGKYQKIQFLLVCLPTIFCAMHALSWTFAAIPVDNRCALPGEEKYSNYWVETKLIAKKKCNESEKHDRCPYETCHFKNGSSCSSIVFDTSEVQQTAIGRWDIVCDRGWIKATVQAFYYVGQMAGSMTFGVLGDKIGRKKVFIIAIAIQIASALALAIAPTWWIYAFFRGCTGFSHPGIFVIAVVIGMELVGPQYRKAASVITGFFFSVGQIILGLTAFFVRDYQLLHVILGAPALVFLSYWWLVPESARWLVSMKRYPEADKVLQRAAKVNGVNLPDQWWTLLDTEKDDSGEEKAVKKYHFTDLLRTPVLRKRTLVVFFLWPVVSMVYYGMSMKSDVLGGDFYLNFIFGAAIEMPALLLVYLLIDRLGRRIILSGGYAIAGLCLLSNLFISSESSKFIALTQLLITKGAITACYAAIYTFSPELFPTVLRNTAMGCCSTIARVGAISASYVSMWLVESFGKAYLIVPFGCLSTIAALLTFFTLPETMGKALPETIEQIEKPDDDAACEMMVTEKNE